MSDDETRDVPAVPNAQSPDGELTLRPDLLPGRVAAERVTDVLPPAAYERVGQFVLTPEAEAVLNEPLPDDEVDIRPDDGMIYASHEFYRRQLNRAFGRMGWTLVPGSPLTQRPETHEWYQRWVLFVGGVYCSEAFESYDYQPNNARMDLSDVAEAIKSGALKRCCKDLGIASECWNKRFQQRWIREHAVQVIAPVWRRGQQINAKLWRRKDADPFKDEGRGQMAVTNQAPAAPPVRPAAPKPAPAPKPVAVKPDAPRPAPAPAAAPPEPEQPSTTVKPAPARKAMLLESQVRLLYARGRNAGLIVGDDATPLVEWLGQNGIPVVEAEGKSSAEIANAMFKMIPPARFSDLVKKLDAYGRGTEPAPESPEDGPERI